MNNVYEYNSGSSRSPTSTVFGYPPLQQEINMIAMFFITVMFFFANLILFRLFLMIYVEYYV